MRYDGSLEIIWAYVHKNKSERSSLEQFSLDLYILLLVLTRHRERKRKENTRKETI